MYSIFIDLDSVVFESSEKVVRKAAIKQYGHPKADFLVACQRAGIFNNYVAKHLDDITSRCSINPPFRSGAKEALDCLATFPGCSIEFYSKIDIKITADDLENYYRQTAPCMNKVQNYHFTALNRSGVLIHARAKKNRSIIYVVSGDMDSIQDAKAKRFMPIMISSKPKDRIAAAEYGAYCFETLKHFQEVVTNER